MAKKWDRGVSMWHPWLDKKGRSHNLAFWHGDTHELEVYSTKERLHIETAEEFFEEITSRRLYVGCSDALNRKSFPFLDDLLKNKRVTPRLSPSNGLTGMTMHVPFTPAHGALIPYKTFVRDPMNFKVVEQYFDLMGYEAISTGSVSEKLFRSTLPYKHGISRPNAMMRKEMIDHAFGGRVQMNYMVLTYTTLYEADFNNAYLCRARRIPTPFKAPHRTSKPDLEDLRRPTYAHVILESAPCTVGPIPSIDIFTGRQLYVRDGGYEIEGWWWNEEIQCALDAGFKVKKVLGGWRWDEYSDCMNKWADLMQEKKRQVAGNPELEALVKLSMVALPGRFQMRPERRTMIPLDESTFGDKPLLISDGDDDEGYVSDFAIRSDAFMQSANLVPQGSHIVMQQRVALYKLLKALDDAGVQVALANTDNVYMDRPLPTHLRHMVGTKDGDLKLRTHRKATVYANRVVSELVNKLPGISGLQREEYIERMKKGIA